jgi:hypothetical protein
VSDGHKILAHPNPGHATTYLVAHQRTRQNAKRFRYELARYEIVSANKIFESALGTGK